MTEKQKPRQAGDQDRGKNQKLINFTKSNSGNQALRQQAAELAAILIGLYLRYPLFFYEPADGEPDLDLESGFKYFSKREVVT